MAWFSANINDTLSAARSNTWTTIITVFSLAFVYVQYRRSPWRKLPPGPKGVPVLGNIFQLGKTQWYTFTEWRKQYGDVVYLNLAGQPAVVLNSLKAAADILDRRAGLNSDRPSYIVASEMMSRNMFMGFTPYNDLWRTMRRASHEGLHKAITPNFHPTQMKEAAILASEIISTPKNWDNHLRRAATSVIASIVYDTPTLKSEEDPLVMEVNQFTARLTKAALPGAHFVESFPWMKHIPASLAKWKQIALESYKKDTSMLTGLMRPVRNQIAAGEDRPSFSATVINDKSHNMTEAESAWLAGSVYAAGAETTSAVMAWWVLGVIAYPDTLKKAREEIDSVVGRDRMPTFDDFDHLPYIRAMAKEVLRWRPVAPLGSPHRSTEDDTYEGHFIPANTILISNIWSINRDPLVFGPDAHEFNPSRFITKDPKTGETMLVPAPYDTKDEHHVAFGFGRRICVGRYVGNDSLFIDIATLVWAMNIEYVGKRPIDLDGYVDEGIVIRPPTLQVKFSPRSPDVREIIERTLEEFGYQK